MDYNGFKSRKWLFAIVSTIISSYYLLATLQIVQNADQVGIFREWIIFQIFITIFYFGSNNISKWIDVYKSTSIARFAANPTKLKELLKGSDDDGKEIFTEDEPLSDEEAKMYDLKRKRK
jgi:hypothetical protein